MFPTKVGFAAFLMGSALLASATTSQSIDLFDAFYRAGSLVFGGGHVVLPILRNEVVPPGWVDDSVFLAGYGAAQALSGRKFLVPDLPAKGLMRLFG